MSPHPAPAEDDAAPSAGSRGAGDASSSASSTAATAATGADHSASDAGLASAVGPVLLVGLLAKLLLVGVVVFAATTQPSDSPYVAPREGDANDVVWDLSRGWDANSYQRMAFEGWYDGFASVRPLGYPALIRAARLLVPESQTAAVLVSNAMSVLALLLFVLVARRCAAGMARDGRASVSAAEAGDGATGAPGATGDVGARVRDAGILFALTPGVLTFGTVAYSESSQIAFGLAAWWCLLRASDPPRGAGLAAVASRDTPAADPDAPRSYAWLALASLLIGVSVMMRHLGAPLLLALGLVELVRVVRRRTRRALLEATALLWTGPLLVAYFVSIWDAVDTHQREIFAMRFVPFGGPPSLLALGISVESVLLIFMTLPLVVLLLARLRAVDGRLLLVALLTLVTAVSFTGIAAQSFTRYAWAIWALPLGALAIRDRAVTWTLAAFLGIVSLWCAVAHVQGSAAL
ncbi:MAG: hypothetical protein H6825_03355 [Planctomycetes bacterium]|nr:hypothetical protein [Planctomycetota bacterium]